ncbi:MAG: hypothetical protein J7M05_09495 [Anaerolineae bacterium]|nr:hypothetical protein [Anaerolineae bacterium]
MADKVAPWTGQVLHVDLTTGTTRTLPSVPYVFSFLGGRGLAARFAWDLIPPGVKPFDPEAPLMFFPGALMGTPAPSSGRVTIAGLSPQAYPHEWYTRSNLGGHWGPMLKYAGYDGLIVTGKASSPVYLQIEDDQVSIREADDLWGRGLIETQRIFRERLGPAWRVLAIGPAGENLVRYAVIATGTESAAGQGGFGAVMGSKNLKAIAVLGHGGVGIAHPEEALRRSRQVSRWLRKRYGPQPIDFGANIAQGAKQRYAPCSYQCQGSCGGFYVDVPGAVYKDRKYTGHLFCCAPIFVKGGWIKIDLGFEAGFEVAQLCNDLGLNHWEFIFGIAPWILCCQERGEFLEIGGTKVDLHDPYFWVEMIEKIARREDWGDVLAEGGPRAAKILGVGEDIIPDFYPAWGQASHWDGHGSFPSPPFPLWLVTSLQWAMDTRDPMGGGHGYTTNIAGLLRKLKPDPNDEAIWKKIAHVGEALYGSAAAVDPYAGYAGKALAAVFHHGRGMLKDSLGICDNIFPLLTDSEAEDLLVHIDGVEGKYLEYYIFEPISGLELSREDFYQAAVRAFTLERLLAIRNWGRDRSTDETIIPYLEKPEGSENPFLGQRVAVDPARYRELMDEYYRLAGWDPETAHPLPETLQRLGLEEFAVNVK